MMGTINGLDFVLLMGLIGALGKIIDLKARLKEAEKKNRFW